MSLEPRAGDDRHIISPPAEISADEFAFFEIQRRIAPASMLPFLLFDGEQNSRIQKVFELPYRYQPARLALSLSLAQAKPPGPIIDGGGRPIKGDTLFGQDEADLTLWIALMLEHSGVVGVSRRDFQDLVAANWARGMHNLAIRSGGLEAHSQRRRRAERGLCEAMPRDAHGWGFSHQNCAIPA